MRGLTFSFRLAGVVAAAALAACGGGQSSTAALSSGDSLGTASVGRALPLVTLSVDATETIGVNLNGQAKAKVKHYGNVLGYFPGTTKSASQVIHIPVGSQVQFESIDTTYPHTAALLGHATKKHAKWPANFTGGTQTSPAGTDISTKGFTTGSLSAGTPSALYDANVPGFYMFGCMYHYVTRGMRTIIIVH
jgi:plastocyanin